MKTGVLLLVFTILSFNSNGLNAQTSSACQVKAVQRMATQYEAFTKSPASDLWAASTYDANGVSQIYITKSPTNDITQVSNVLACITCTSQVGAPRVDRNKFMVNWHPSGQWLTV